MFGKNLFYAIIGFTLAISTSSVLALTSVETNSIMDEQLYAQKYTGTYQPVYEGPVKVFTYETICKGFYTIEDNGVEIKYTGFGDLADEYTFSEPSLSKVDSLQVSTSTPIDEKLIDSEPVILPVVSSTTDISY